MVLIKYFKDAPTVICKKTYINKDGLISRKGNKPAYFEYNKEGLVIKRGWYQNGKLHRDNDKPALIETLFNDPNKIVLECWYKNGQLHRDNDKPAYVEHYGGKHLQWYQNGKLHRDYDRPAEIMYNDVGRVEYEKWYQNGQLHRDNDEPAYMKQLHLEETNLTINNIVHQWYTHGKICRKNGKPIEVRYDMRGNLVLEIFSYEKQDESNPLKTPNIKQYEFRYDEIYYYTNGLFHTVSKNDEGKITYERYSMNDPIHAFHCPPHNENGPAVISYFSDGKRVEEWFKDGTYYRKDDLPTKVKYLADGSVYKEIWHDSSNNVISKKFYHFKQTQHS